MSNEDYIAGVSGIVEDPTCLICSSIVISSKFDEYDRKIRELGEMRGLAERCTKHVNKLENKIVELQQKIFDLKQELKEAKEYDWEYERDRTEASGETAPQD